MKLKLYRKAQLHGIFKDFCKLLNILDILLNYKDLLKNGYYILNIILFQMNICFNYKKLLRNKVIQKAYDMMQFQIINVFLVVGLVKMLAALQVYFSVLHGRA